MPPSTSFRWAKRYRCERIHVRPGEGPGLDEARPDTDLGVGDAAGVGPVVGALAQVDLETGGAAEDVLVVDAHLAVASTAACGGRGGACVAGRSAPGCGSGSTGRLVVGGAVTAAGGGDQRVASATRAKVDTFRSRIVAHS